MLCDIIDSVLILVKFADEQATGRKRNTVLRKNTENAINGELTIGEDYKEIGDNNYRYLGSKCF